MKKGPLAVALILSCSLHGTAMAVPGDKGVDGPRCKAIAMRVAENTMARFERFNVTRTMAVFKHPMANEIIVHCWGKMPISVAISINSPFPDELWFYVAAQAAAALSSSSEKDLEAAIRSCHKKALGVEEGSSASESSSDIRIDCTVYTSEPLTSFSFTLTN